MSPRLSRKRGGKPAASAERFLRSINICLDAERPESIAHFRPTRKSVSVLSSLAGLEAERSFLVVAPYGSGKSLTATYLLHLVEGRKESAEACQVVGDRLADVSPRLASWSRERSSSTERGLAIALYGPQQSFVGGLKSAILDAFKRNRLGRQARPLKALPAERPEHGLELLRLAQRKARETGLDRLTILWDEFGRHLEFLAAEGRSSELGELQSLAEYVSRTDEPPVTVGLFLHQSLLTYAGRIPQATRAEWKKIEGRFKAIQYVDTSREIYRLIAEVVASRRRAVGMPDERFIEQAASDAVSLGLFPDFDDQDLKEVFSLAYPLEPATLYLLPRLAARVAQNERTLFSFLFSHALAGPIGPEELFDFFSEEMRSDASVGGTYRRWLETRSALSKVGDDERATKVLKTTCLLGLGLAGERAKAGRETLLFSLAGYGELGELESTVAGLVERHLLLHRKHGDEISIWHGTDKDLRGRLEEEKRGSVHAFPFEEFLAREAPPPVWKPIQYNDAYSMRRFFRSEYRDMTSFALFPDLDQEIKPGVDGKILYLMPSSEEEQRDLEAKARQDLLHPQIVLAVPKRVLPIREVALELWCLQRMQTDADLVEADPLILPELQQMVDDARGQLQRLLDQVVWPARDGATWYHRGKPQREVRSPRDLRRLLSEVMFSVFPDTPKINNEMIVRAKPSATIVNSRKKLILGMLERSGLERLGIEGNFPDAAMFRTVLLRTGLYKVDSEGRWGYAEPSELEDPGLGKVWGQIGDFFAGRNGESLAGLLESLARPPFGVRRGVLPILIAAAFKAFPKAVVLTKDGEYVEDILPSVVEDICRNPRPYELKVAALSEKEEAYVRRVYDLFSSEVDYQIPEHDLFRMCFDALQGWAAQLSPGALKSKDVGRNGRALRAALKLGLDPSVLLLEELPKRMKNSVRNVEKLVRAIQRGKEELESVETAHLQRAESLVRTYLGLASDGPIRSEVEAWAENIPDEFLSSIGAPRVKAFVARCRFRYSSDRKLLESIASLLTDRSLFRWDDSTVAKFEDNLADVLRTLDERLLYGPIEKWTPAIRQAAAGLVERRLEDLLERYVAIAGRQYRPAKSGQKGGRGGKS